MRMLLFLLLTASIIACDSNTTAKTTKSDFYIDSVKAHIMKMNESYSERFITKDSNYYSQRYCKDASVLCPGVPAVTGLDSIINFFLATEQIPILKLNYPLAVSMATKTW